MLSLNLLNFDFTKFGKFLHFIYSDFSPHNLFFLSSFYVTPMIHMRDLFVLLTHRSQRPFIYKKFFFSLILDNLFSSISNFTGSFLHYLHSATETIQWIFHFTCSVFLNSKISKFFMFSISLLRISTFPLISNVCNFVSWSMFIIAA